MCHSTKNNKSCNYMFRTVINYKKPMRASRISSYPRPPDGGVWTVEFTFLPGGRPGDLFAARKSAYYDLTISPFPQLVR